jgi:hypothetical protein
VFRYSRERKEPGNKGLFGRLDEWDGQLISAGMAAEQQADLLNLWLDRCVPERKSRPSGEREAPTSAEFGPPHTDGKEQILSSRPSPASCRTALLVCGLALLNLCLATYQVWAYFWSRLFFLALIGLVGWAVVYLYLALRRQALPSKTHG